MMILTKTWNICLIEVKPSTKPRTLGNSNDSSPDSVPKTTATGDGGNVEGLTGLMFIPQDFSGSVDTVDLSNTQDLSKPSDMAKENFFQFSNFAALPPNKFTKYYVSIFYAIS